MVLWTNVYIKEGIVPVVEMNSVKIRNIGVVSAGHNDENLEGKLMGSLSEILTNDCSNG